MTRWLLAITSLSSTGADSTGTEMPERFRRISDLDDRLSCMISGPEGRLAPSRRISDLDDRVPLHYFRSGRAACPRWSQDLR